MKSKLLDVPYYRQTRFSTCGPAALMMIIKYWDNSFEFSRQVERKIWLRSNPFVFLGGNLQYGLASTAKELGFTAQIYQKNHFSDNYSAFHRVLKLYEKIITFDSKSASVPIYFSKDQFEVIKEALKKKIPPLVLVNLLPIVGENVFHWLVVTGIETDEIFVNDPYVPMGCNLKEKKDVAIKKDNFLKAISTNTSKLLRLPQCVVVINK